MATAYLPRRSLSGASNDGGQVVAFLLAVTSDRARVGTGATAGAADDASRCESLTKEFQMSATTEAAPNTAIRPFKIGFAEADFADLRRRISATRWPEPETVGDDSQGAPLAMMQELASYWAGEYDWSRIAAKLNALPNFITEIDGLDIHFIHVRSRHENALPLIVTHGWPGTILEQLKIIEPLTNPENPADAFDLVIPSLPGHGFSAKPTSTGGIPCASRAHGTC